jgi:hypothetical protein
MFIYLILYRSLSICQGDLQFEFVDQDHDTCYNHKPDPIHSVDEYENNRLSDLKTACRTHRSHCVASADHHSPGHWTPSLTIINGFVMKVINLHRMGQKAM